MLRILLGLLFVTMALAGPRIVVEDAWVRSVPPVSKTTAAFMRIRNEGDEPDRLIGVTTSIAERAEIHETVMDKGVMRMRRVESLTIPPGRTVVLKPMGKHIMIIGLKESVDQVGKVRIVLVFEKSGRIVVETPVRPLER